MFDLIIKDGTLVDGTGNPAVKADVAIIGDRIAKIGNVNGAESIRTIDASGKIVTPGFIDLHTHLDAQIGWDPKMTPSSYHGVTTVLSGNCGVTFAPVSKKNRRFLAEVMEAVEDISADIIMDGLPWNWTSFGEYLDTIETLNPTLNFCGLVGHSAIRLEVMGDRSMDEGAQATDDELARICDLVKKSLEEGAAGFSTSRHLEHKIPDGRCTPGTFANTKETSAIQRAVIEGGGRGTLFQAVPNFTQFNQELEMLKIAAEGGCKVVFTTGGSRTNKVPDFLAEQNARGLEITAACHVRPSYAFFSLARLAPFRTPAWNDLMALPNIPQRLEALQDSAFRDTLVTEASKYGFALGAEAKYIHPLGTGECPNWDMDQQMSLQQIADREGKDPARVFVDRVRQSEGREFFNYWGHVKIPELQWRFMQQPHCIPVLGDAGAHVGMFTDADSTTFLLSELTRNRGIFSLPEAVYRITGKSAKMVGLKNRGELHEGWYADINVIDFDELDCRQPYFVNDLPHSGGRVVTESQGIDLTMVNGEIIIQNGVFTGTRPGQVIREFYRD